MKKVSILFAGLFITIASFALQAEVVSSDFFVGKWNLVIEDLPNGDAELLITFQRQDGKLTGIVEMEENDEIKITKVEEVKDKSVTVILSVPNYDLEIFIEEKGENEVKGTLMDMFDLTGKRVLEKE